MKIQFVKLIVLFVVLTSLGFFTGTVLAESITVVNPSFESGTTGWSGITVDNSEEYSPVDGTYYATRSGGAGYTTQLTGHTIAAGETFTLTVWTRSMNDEGNTNVTNAEVRLYYGSTTINAVTQDVNPVRLLGDPRTYPNDDGGNVWLDAGYRMEFADHVFYQLQSADPLYDTWSRQNDSDYDHDMAVGPIITPQGLKACYNTYYDDPIYSEIWILNASGSPPNYTWNPGGVILSHDGDENPWVIDAHLYYDNDTGRLWMSWGGLPLRVSEMDPSNGELIDHPSNPEFDSHPSWYHTTVANWSGDEWSSDWAEGPCLFKHNGYWYFLASYGDLAVNYTIRGGRGNSPTGPFYDKDGVGLKEWDSSESEYGNTILLGADGGQANPGHPHIWEENGKYYMGYDYVDKYTGEKIDRFGIRRLYWVDDWPTIWTPITVTFNADDYPPAIGQQLGISLRNTGSGSNAVFDYVSLEYTPGAPDADPIEEFNDFIANWLQVGCGNCDGADLTGDGKVDLEDFSIYYLENWLEDNLMGYWRMNNSVADSSLNDRDGSLVDGAGFVEDPDRGWVLSLDGDGDYMQITGYKGVIAIRDRTVCAWIKTTSGDEIMSWGENATGKKWVFRVRPDGEIRVEIAGGGVVGETIVNDGKWHHVAAVWQYSYGPDVTDVKLYVDGGPPESTIGSAEAINTTSDVDVTIGVYPGSGRYFNGLIDDVRIYNRALDEGEIAALAGL